MQERTWMDVHIAAAVNRMLFPSAELEERKGKHNYKSRATDYLIW